MKRFDRRFEGEFDRRFDRGFDRRFDGRYPEDATTGCELHSPRQLSEPSRLHSGTRLSAEPQAESPQPAIWHIDDQPFANTKPLRVSPEHTLHLDIHQHPHSTRNVLAVQRHCCTVTPRPYYVGHNNIGHNYIGHNDSGDNYCSLETLLHSDKGVHTCVHASILCAYSCMFVDRTRTHAQLPALLTPRNRLCMSLYSLFDGRFDERFDGGRSMYEFVQSVGAIAALLRCDA